MMVPSVVVQRFAVEIAWMDDAILEFAPLAENEETDLRALRASRARSSPSK
jgi:hypothetical protein